MKQKKIEFVGYTVKDWKNIFYHNRKHINLNNYSKIPDDLIICDVCNKEIRQPKDEPNKKVVWDYSGEHKEGNWALCTVCKNSPKDFDNSKRLMDSYKKLIKYPEKKLEAIQDFVDQSLMDGLRKGWYKFEDSLMTLDKWLKLSGVEKENYPIGLTQLGKTEGADTENILRFIQDKEVFDSLFDKFDVDDDGNVKIRLTKLGQQSKMLYEMSGLDFSEFLQKKLTGGIKKMFSEFIVLEKNETYIKGQIRLLKKI